MGLVDDALRNYKPTCWHAGEDTLICGKPATEFSLPDRTTGIYCAEHGPKVVARVERRLRLKRQKEGN